MPHGFVLVTQFEWIFPDGRPGKEPARWRAELPPVNEQGFFDFLRALRGAPSGYYRVIAFVVTDAALDRSTAAPTGGDAERWLTNGLDRLPENVGRLAYGSGYRTKALVYEFRNRSVSAVLIPESATAGRQHLQRAGIDEHLSLP